MAFMTLAIFQVILVGRFAIILPISIQGGALERFTFSATERTVVLQSWDCRLLEKLKYLFHQVELLVIGLWYLIYASFVNSKRSYFSTLP